VRFAWRCISIHPQFCSLPFANADHVTHFIAYPLHTIPSHLRREVCSSRGNIVSWSQAHMSFDTEKDVRRSTSFHTQTRLWAGWNIVQYIIEESYQIPYIRTTLPNLARPFTTLHSPLHPSLLRLRIRKVLLQVRAHLANLVFKVIESYVHSSVQYHPTFRVKKRKTYLRNMASCLLRGRRCLLQISWSRYKDRLDRAATQ
jgi:hypothetical protein